MTDASRPSPSEPSPGSITRILDDAARGRPGATDALFPLVYDQLRRIACKRMSGENPGNTLQATVLVHDAFLKLVGEGGPEGANRAHFFRVAAEAMRRLLIEHARSRGRRKRGGGRARLPLNVLDLAAEPDEPQIVALDEAVRRFEEVDPAAAEVLRLRFYAGLSVEHTAEALGVSPRSVKRDWAFARAWLYRALEGDVKG